MERKDGVGDRQGCQVLKKKKCPKPTELGQISYFTKIWRLKADRIFFILFYLQI